MEVINKNYRNITYEKNQISLNFFVIINFILSSFVITYGYRFYFKEFYIYPLSVSLVLLMYLIVWQILKHYKINKMHFIYIILLQLGILMHYSGTLIYIDKIRLYDIYIFKFESIPFMNQIGRFDKIVHFYNSLIGVFIFKNLWKKIGYVIDNRFIDLLIIVTLVVGIGAFIEISEFITSIYFTKLDGVIGYNNNLQDMIANLYGALLAMFIIFISKFFNKIFHPV